jgi:hypothetical protein
VTPKGKLSKSFAKKIVIGKNMKDLLLDSIPKTMEAKRHYSRKNVYY